MQQQNNPIIRQSSSAVPSSSVILGAPKYIRIDDVPICMGNSRICKFISCTAHNFKNDESFANLNLAAQVLSDKKLRQAISSDPDTLRTICHEQQLAPAQCKLFTDGFVLIDRFITSIEGGGDGDGRRVRVIHATTTTMQSPFRQETISPAAAAADTMPGVVDERYGRTAPQQRASRTTQFDDNQQHPMTMRRTILNPYLFEQQSNWFADSSTVKGAEDFIDYDDFGNIYERHHTKRATRDELDRSARRTLGESVSLMTSQNKKDADDDTTTDYYDSVQQPTGDRQQRPRDCFAILG